MVNILFTWERGKNIGHVLPHLQLIRELQARRHRVLFAAQNVTTAEEILKPLGCPVVQAPPAGRRLPPAGRNLPLANLPQMFFNVGFHDPVETSARLRSWREIFASFQPDLLVADFSPTALLAAHGSPIKRVAFGLGYLFPPDEDPMPAISFWQDTDTEKARFYQGRLLTAIRQACAPLALPPVARLSVLTQGELNLISSLPELDSHPRRTTPFQYHYDPATIPGSVPPVWPRGRGKRLFGYLHPSPWLYSLLQAIQKRGCPALFYGPALPAEIKKAFASPQIHFTTELLDIKLVREECDLALFDASSGSIGQMLWAGKPMLLLTQDIDQRINGRKAWEAGVALVWPPFATGDGKGVVGCLDRLLTEPEWSSRAMALSAQIRQRTPEANPAILAAELENQLRG